MNKKTITTCTPAFNMEMQISPDKLKRHIELLVTDEQETDDVQVKDEPEVDEAQFYNTTGDTATNDPLMLELKSEPPDEYDTGHGKIQDKRKEHNTKNDLGVKNKVILNFSNLNKPFRVYSSLTPLDNHNVATAIYPPAKTAPKFYVNASKSVKTYRPTFNPNVVKKPNNTPGVSSKATAVNGPVILNKVLGGMSSDIRQASKLRDIPVIASTNEADGTRTPSLPVVLEPPKSSQPSISINKSVDSKAQTAGIDNKESPVVASISKNQSNFKIPPWDADPPKPNWRILKGSTPLPEPETKKKVNQTKYVLVPKNLKPNKTDGTSGVILCTADQIRPIYITVPSTVTGETKSDPKSLPKSTRQTVESSKNPTVCGTGSTDKLILNNNEKHANLSNAAQSISVDQDLQPILSSLDNTQAKNNSQNISSTPSRYTCEEEEEIQDFQPYYRDDLAIENSVNNLPEDDDDFDPYDLSPLPSPDTTDYTPEGPLLDEASGTFINTSLTENDSATKTAQASKDNTNLNPKKIITTLNSLIAQTAVGHKQTVIKNGRTCKLVKNFTAEDLVREFKKVQAQKETQKARQSQQKLKGQLRRRVRSTQRAVFEELTVDMNPVARKIFWTQINAGKRKHVSGNRFSHEEKVLFASIQALSHPCYSILEKIFIVPGSKTLELYNKSLEKANDENGQPELNREEYQLEEYPNQAFLMEHGLYVEENRGISQSCQESARNDVSSERRAMKRNAGGTKKHKGKPAKQGKKKKLDETSLAIASISDYQTSEAVNSSNLIHLSELQDIGSQEYVYSTTDALEHQTVADNRLADASDIWITHGEPESLLQMEHAEERVVKHSIDSLKLRNSKNLRYVDEFGKYLVKNVELRGTPRTSV